MIISCLQAILRVGSNVKENQSSIFQFSNKTSSNWVDWRTIIWNIVIKYFNDARGFFLDEKHKIDLFLKTFHCYLHLQWLMFCYSIMFILNLYKEAVLFNVRKKYHHKNVPIRSSPSNMKYSTQLCCWKTKLNHTKGRFSALLHCTGFLEKIHNYVSLFLKPYLKFRYKKRHKDRWFDVANVHFLK